MRSKSSCLSDSQLISPLASASAFGCTPNFSTHAGNSSCASDVVSRAQKAAEKSCGAIVTRMDLARAECLVLFEASGVDSTPPKDLEKA